MDNTQTIHIEVAYARPDTQVIIPVAVPIGTQAQEAIQLSGILNQFPEIDLSNTKIGIFSKIIKPDTVLQERDRVEIYRPLLADPKDSRRARAEKKHQAETTEKE